METYEILDHLVAPWHQNHKLEIAEKSSHYLELISEIEDLSSLMKETMPN